MDGDYWEAMIDKGQSLVVYGVKAADRTRTIRQTKCINVLGHFPVVRDMLM